MPPVQLSVSKKSAEIAMLLIIREVLPVFVTVIVCGPLWVCTGCPLNVKFAGASVIVVCGTPLNRGACQIPLPYVPTRRYPPLADVDVSFTAGARGRPVPKMFQH